MGEPLTEGFPGDDRDPYAFSFAHNLLYQEVRRYQAQGITYRSGVELSGIPCKACGTKHYVGQRCKVCNPTPPSKRVAEPADGRLALAE